MKNTVVLILVLIRFTAVGQETLYVGPQSNNIDKSVYTAMQNIWYGNEKISYLCFPIINDQITPAIPLRKGEGVNGKYVFEANLYYQVPIAMGRNQGSHFLQTSRVTFDFGFNIRMAQEDSSPLIPNNNIIGLTFENIIYNSHTKDKAKRKNFGYSFENWYENNKDKDLHTVSANLSVHHFSNGQQDSLFVNRTVDGENVRRNNYKSGDFSTNTINLGATYSYLSKKRNLFSANLAYQFDGNLVGPLSFTEEQKDNYGQHRLMSFLQFRKLGKAKLGRHQHDTHDIVNDTRVPIVLKYYREYVIRWESEYILDSDLSQYISTSRKYRFNQHLYLQYTQPNWRAMGFVLHAYYGRDYSNVRYDMPIFAIMGGISINFNKYNPPLDIAKRYN